MRRPHSYHPQTVEAAKIFGLQVAQARRRRRMTVAELCERVQASPVTVRKVERGDPTVAMGIAFECASILGIELFGVDGDRLPSILAREEDRYRLLPSRVVEPDDEPPVF
jgi:transcriptional regulator with XRE-family HTH domain